MNQEIKRELRNVLLKLKKDCFQLAATVTQGFLKDKLESEEDAINAIIHNSPDAESILKRKIVTKEILFSYLYENGIAVSLPVTKNTLITLIINKWNSNNHPDVPSGRVEPNEEYPSNVSEMALKFSEWFYNFMNSNEPISSEHFWKDASLKLNIISGLNSSNSQEVLQNSEEIVSTLFNVKTVNNLTFNPNLLSNGVQGQINHHGLVRVVCCGTLSTNNYCVGVFEQMFLLARDPSAENNWKIKSTEINLRSQNALPESPSMENNSLHSNYLQT